jgi:probable HAF family extracellular repeat protein
MMPARNPWLRSLLLPLAACPLLALADPVFTMRFLPDGFQASALNNAGQIVGTQNDGAAIWSETGLINLSSVAPNSTGMGINNRGDVVGALASGNAFAYISGTVHNLGPSLPNMFEGSYGRGINDNGVVAGTAFPGAGESDRAFVYDNGQLTMLGTFGGAWSNARAINQAGYVVGDAATVGAGGPFFNDYHGFLFKNGTMQDLGTFGGYTSSTQDVNEAGQVVGWSTTNIDYELSEIRPFLFQNGQLIDMGSLGGHWGYAHGINNAGMAVGESDIITTEGWGSHAFIYLNGQMIDLNKLVDGANGWELINAQDINDSQQILGTACRLGTCEQILLSLVSAVPEPYSQAMLLAGLGILAGLGRLKRARKQNDAAAGALSWPLPPSQEKPMRIRPLWRALMLALASLPLAAFADPQYTITYLPDSVEASGLNNAGQVVGRLPAAYEGYPRGFVWTGGNLAILPTLGGPASTATGINASGVVIGNSDSGDVGRAFAYSDGTIHNLGSLEMWYSSTAHAINVSGQIVGDSYDAIGDHKGFLYQNGVLSAIGGLGGRTIPNAISDNGIIAGGSVAPYDNDFWHAFMQLNGTVTDLGTLGGANATARGVNNAGQVVGESNYDMSTGDTHAFMLDHGSLRDLGTFGGNESSARAINASGMVVGSAETLNQTWHGFLYVNGQKMDLNGMVTGLGGSTVKDAIAINDSGQILASLCGGFECQSVLLNPLTPVPEPPAYALLLCALALAGWLPSKLSRLQSE